MAQASLAVAGYDLSYGLGYADMQSPDPARQSGPLTNTTPLVELEFIIGTGKDNLRTNFVLTMDVLLPDGVSHLTGTLHPANSGEWPNNDSDQFHRGTRDHWQLQGPQ